MSLIPSAPLQAGHTANIFQEMTPGFGAGLVIPDLWQQDAVRALQQGKDVVVQAPTGSGKTYIFELFYPVLKEQAVFTVPTRALANDKLAEWRARGWDVGISTGDVALNLENINNYGLIEIYETVLRRGKDLSINSGISYDPANDALLLAADSNGDSNRRAPHAAPLARRQRLGSPFGGPPGRARRRVRARGPRRAARAPVAAGSG